MRLTCINTVSGMAFLSVIAVVSCFPHFTSGKAEDGDAMVTFSRQIAPLIYAHCTGCHRKGEAAPFELFTYADARKHAKDIADLTQRRVMPPWKAEHAFGEFVGERRLNIEQIELLQQWVKEGCPAGDLSSAPQPPTFAEGWQLGEPDMVVTMPEAYSLVAEGRDVYRCFVIPLQVPSGKYIKSVEYRAGNRKIVHHAVLTMMPHNKAIEKLAGGDGKSFSSGLNAPGQRLPGPLGIWTPGLEPQPLPQGFAVPWRAGFDLVLQLHLHPSGKAESEQSSVGLHFTDEAPRGHFESLVLLDKQVDISAGEGNYVVDKSIAIRAAVQAYGIFPHMHLLGRTVKVTATLPDGTIRPLLSIVDWDFNWQNYYQYQTPVLLPAGTRVDAHWTFDNSAANPANPSIPPKRVVFGEQTTNEMAALLLDVIPAPAHSDPARAPIDH
jgi:mono/diheme cytochrome c family protein